jgi:catechol 2,3-dioxygenase-like lactoylglutathione lyase family enzyme
MRRFYEAVLGLPVARELPDWLEFAAGDAVLALKPGRGGADAAPHHLAFSVSAPADVDAWHDTLAAAGVEIVERPRDQAWDERTCFLRDPERNLVEVYAPLTGG